MILYTTNIKNFCLKLKLKQLAKTVAEQTKQTYAMLAITVAFVSEDKILELNAAHRNKPSVTDVLSFPMIDLKPYQVVTASDFPAEVEEFTKQIYLGDIAICLSKAKEQSKQFGHSLRREICFLAVHGMLHLLGFDHETPEDEAEMFALTEQILKQHKLER